MNVHFGSAKQATLPAAPHADFHYQEAQDAQRRLSRCEHVFEYAPLALLVTDQKWTILKLNRAAISLLATPKKKVVNKSLKRFLDRQSMPAFQLFCKELLNKGENRCSLTLAGNPIRHIQIVASVNTEFIPDRTCFTVGFFELSHQVNTREALVESNNRLQALIRSSRQINSSLNIETIMRRLVEYAMKIVDGTAGAAGYYQDGEMVFREYIDRGKIVPIYFRFKPGEGVPGYVLRTKKPYISNDVAHDIHVISQVRKALKFYNLIDVPILANDGELLGCFEIHNKAGHGHFDESDRAILQGLAAGAAVALQNARLVTRLKQAEENSSRARDELKQLNRQLQEKNRALDTINAKLRDLNRQKTEFVSMASHELRTPLTGIVGFAETLQAQDMQFSPQEQKHFLHIIESEGKRLAGILGDLLDVSKIESGVSEMNLNKTNLIPLIEDTVEMIKSKRAVKIDKNLTPPETLNIVGDCNRLKQVFVNLLDNALRYTPPEGTISISTHPGDRMLRISVSDQGPGIDPQILPRVFDKFVKAKNGLESNRTGSGLGLAIVKGIVEAHGGAVWVDTEPGKGSTFSFTLPRAV